MIVKKLVLGELKTNCYFIINEKTSNAIIIDAGAEYETIKSYITTENLKVCAVLLTHGHFDHIGACAKLQKDGIKIVIHSLDADKCKDNSLNLSNAFGEDIVETFNADVLLDNKEGEYEICDFKIKYIHTPGHSVGSCSFLIEDYLFSGDTIFDMGYGRTDFYDGSPFQLSKSIEKLMPYLRRGYKLLAGH
ncbi:MAG: MBL fold metallo-hydrolase [Clostridia bacterium]|nr:MBL fold metallo-hydrolase [Clostridia bacterium]